MSHPFRRRLDVSRSVHERARFLAARRLDGDLDAADAAWLDHHLRDCARCRAVAEAYDAERLELRALRDRAPQPPRDLWARTVAAIETEAARSERRASRPFLRRGRPSPIPLGALSGVLVVAVVVGASLLSGRTVPRPSTSPGVTDGPLTAEGTPRPRSIVPTATPITIPPVDVAWGVRSDDGVVAINFSRLDEVCGSGANCAPIDSETPLTVELPEGDVRSLILSPTDGQVVLVDEDAATDGGSVLVVPVRTPDTTPQPSPSTPVSTPSPSPTATPVPPSPSADPPASPTPSVEPTGSGEPTVSPSPSASPTLSPDDDPVEIATDVIVVGESASYSPDGTWFAFSARPEDGSHGPDIYVWRLGLETALPITTDHRSVIAGWVGGRILASRAVPVEPLVDPDASASPVVSVAPSSATPSAVVTPDPDAAYRPETLLIDPATSEETILTDVVAWRPSVDPTGRHAVYWDGTLQMDAATFEMRPAEGRLVLAAWPEMPEPQPLPDPSGDPTASGEPDASSEPTRSPEATAPIPSAGSSGDPDGADSALTVLVEAPVNDWDARWDESGTHLALWIEDPLDPTFGQLTLRIIDPETGEPTSDRPALGPRPALPGFSMENGRLAWATRDGEDGERSKLSVAAWTDDEIGLSESRGGDQKVIIVR